MSQSLGFGRAVGQVYAYLYFSRASRSLADMQEALGISKGSASMTVRQLEQWGAVKQVWVKGDRKDYYRANDWFGRILKNLLFDSVGKKLASYSAMLDEADAELANQTSDREEQAFIKDRIAHLRKFQSHALSVWNSPVMKMLMK